MSSNAANAALNNVTPPPRQREASQPPKPRKGNRSAQLAHLEGREGEEASSGATPCATALSSCAADTTPPPKAPKADDDVPRKPTKRKVTHATDTEASDSKRNGNGSSSGSSSSSSSSSSSRSVASPKEAEAAFKVIFPLPSAFDTTVATAADSASEHHYGVVGGTTYAVNSLWFGMSGPGVNLKVDPHRIAAYFEFMVFYHDGTNGTGAWWPSHMAAAFMTRVLGLFEVVPDESQARVLTDVMNMLASAAKAQVFKEYPMNTLFAAEFKFMFGRVVKNWLTKDAAIRDALYQAYERVMVVTPMTAKESFDFLLVGASCFPTGFSQAAPLDMRSFEARYEECRRGVFANVCQALVEAK